MMAQLRRLIRRRPYRVTLTIRTTVGGRMADITFIGSGPTPAEAVAAAQRAADQHFRPVS